MSCCNHRVAKQMPHTPSSTATNSPKLSPHHKHASVWPCCSSIQSFNFTALTPRHLLKTPTAYQVAPRLRIDIYEIPGRIGFVHRLLASPALHYFPDIYTRPTHSRAACLAIGSNPDRILARWPLTHITPRRHALQCVKRAIKIVHNFPQTPVLSACFPLTSTKYPK